MSSSQSLATPKLPIVIFDNKGKSFDRYTVVYLKFRERSGLYPCRGMSEHPTHPQGFGQMSFAIIGRHLGKKIVFSDLPPDCQQLVLSDLKG